MDRGPFRDYKNNSTFNMKSKVLKSEPLLVSKVGTSFDQGSMFLLDIFSLVRHPWPPINQAENQLLVNCHGSLADKINIAYLWGKRMHLFKEIFHCLEYFISK